MTTLNKRIKVTIAGISVALVIAGCSTMDMEVVRPTSAPDAVVTRSRSASSKDSSYADGVYTAAGQYGNLPSFITMTVTLVDDIITAVEVTPQATNPTSLDLQRRFAAAVPAVVVGKHIDEVKVDRLAGSSGTPDGFNAAIERIKEQARIGRTILK
jgi:uncharacterized protein with FMN-binding domain